MRNKHAWILTAVGFVGLLFGLSFALKGSSSGTTVHIGQPDPWFEWTSQYGVTSFEIGLLRWSFGSLIIGLLAIAAAIRFGRRPDKSVGTS